MPQIEPSPFVVSTDGDDAGPGTDLRPFRTLTRARDAVRERRRSESRPTWEVVVRGGLYPVTETLAFDRRDSGNAGERVVFRAAPGERPVLDGGVRISVWRRSTPDVWEAEVPAGLSGVRQFYVDGVRRRRAGTPFAIKGSGWTYDARGLRDGYLVPRRLLPELDRPQHAELSQLIQWRHYRVPIRTFEHVDSETVAIRFNREAFDVALSNTPYSQTPTFNNEFHIENDPALLEEAGAWCFDPARRILRYRPVDGEDIDRFVATVPAVQTLLEVKGDGPGSYAENIELRGLTFRHAAWDAPTAAGFVTNQTDYLLAPRGPSDGPLAQHPPAAVQVDAARSIRFIDCRIEHVGAIGLAVHYAHRVQIDGCVVYDTSDTGITIGTQAGAVIDQPWEETPTFNSVTRSLIHRTGVEYGSAPGIQVYFTQDTLIEHNDVSATGGGGIDLNSWTPDVTRNRTRRNRVLRNHVHDYMTRTIDCGGIYTWSVLGDGTVENDSEIAWNHIEGGHAHYGALYLDETSRFVRAHHNVIDRPHSNWLYLWRHTIRDVRVIDNYATTTDWVNRATDSVVDPPILFDPAAPPTAVRAIIEGAGLPPTHRHLLEGVGEPPVPPPTVKILAPRTVRLTEDLHLDAVVDDASPVAPRCLGLRLHWSKISGPGDVTFHFRSGLRTTAAFSRPGDYVLRLTVRDGERAQSETIRVRVAESELGRDLITDAASVTAGGERLVHNAPGRFAVENVLDPDPACGWEADGSSPTFLIVDLGSPVVIQRIEILTNQGAHDADDIDQQGADLVVSASNDPEMSPVESVVIGSLGGRISELGLDRGALGVFNVRDPHAYRYLKIRKEPDIPHLHIAALHVRGESA
ncbi:right-handed parallel beta-helix repeat-containing protein [Microbacterium sp. BK668]|uniref:right-handed parallel beta-helix repeat-containing protein n=1 Tax=Microbacterium sp. BK668 TaxID=2512118 RepID=UPI001061F512|nr:right-handed parallel beta-helix repeat-containing protein [Microbacterium sp. BK668]TDN91538.1 parallel beta helix pectate lyase-like protein [Microbacterium sp. BK668]